MTVRRNTASRFRTTTTQPISVPGRILLRFGALGSSAKERMSVSYEIDSASPVKFVGPSGPTSAVAVTDGADGSGNVRPATPTKDSVEVRNGLREVVFDAELTLDAGGVAPSTIDISVVVRQNGADAFSDATQVALGAGATFAMKSFATKTIELTGGPVGGPSMMVMGDAATVREIALEALRQFGAATAAGGTAPTPAEDGTPPAG